jgi:nucleoside-diphosphate-sugar epimerase
MNVSTAGQKRLVIVGATGMVGGYALRYALEHHAVKSATAIARRKLGISHPKLNEVLHRDFADCSALAEALSGQDAAVFCLGVYTGALSDAQLRTITVDFTVEFARVLRASSPEAALSFLSGKGAAVNYTSLGYGDLIKTPSWRLLGPLETANGMLLFGVSTAMIFAVML